MADNYIATPRGNFVDSSNVNTPGVLHRANSVASFTRPNDNTTYTAGDMMGATASCLLQFPAGRFGPNQGDSGYIHGVRYTKSSNGVSSATFKLYLFSAPITDGADNAPFNLSYTDAASYIGDWSPPTMTSAGACATVRDATRFGYVIPSQTIYGILTATAGYIPQTNEQFTIMLYLEQTAVA